MTRGSPSSARGAATLQLVLKASTNLFAERGFAATSMRQLADRANLPLSAFYYYFRGKYEVLLAIMDAAMMRLEMATAAALDQDLTPSEQLVALIEAHVGVHLTDPSAAKVADRELRALLPFDRDAMVARRDAYERLFRSTLQAGARNGDFSPDLDVQLASIAILTMSTGVVDWWHPGGRHTIAETSRIFGRMGMSVACANLTYDRKAGLSP